MRISQPKGQAQEDSGSCPRGPGLQSPQRLSSNRRPVGTRMRNTSAAAARSADARQGLLSRGCLVAKGNEGRGSLARPARHVPPPAPPSPPHVRRTRGPHIARRRLSVCGSPARTAGCEGLGPRPGHCPAAPGARWGRCPRAGRRGPHLGKATGSPGAAGSRQERVPGRGRVRGRGRGPGRAPGWGRPRPGGGAPHQDRCLRRSRCRSSGPAGTCSRL